MADFSVDLRRFFGFLRIFGGFVAAIGGRWNKKGRTDVMIHSAFFVVVRLTGLEPAHRKTPDPKSGASTNFATGAILRVQR